jgi:hydrogenase nickel incorporation protein HypA/HybF
MHETALVRDVVHRIEDLARSAGARRVTGAKVWLGALSHLSPDHFRDHFIIEAQGTLAAGAALEIEASEARTQRRCLCADRRVGRIRRGHPRRQSMPRRKSRRQFCRRSPGREWS